MAPTIVQPPPPDRLSMMFQNILSILVIRIQNIQMDQIDSTLKQSVTLTQKAVHKDEITGISVQQTNNDIILTISSDYTMRLWDMRLNSSVKLFKLENGEDMVANCIVDEFHAYGACGSKVEMFDIRTSKIIVAKSDHATTVDSEINQLTFDKGQKIISCSMDSGDNIIIDKTDLRTLSTLSGVHKQCSFSSDFVMNKEGDKQFCITSSFDYNLVVWNYEDRKTAQPLKQTDLNILHQKYAQGAVSPPIIYSVVTDQDKVLASVETGQIYYFNHEILTKKKKPPIPIQVFDAHICKVMRSVFCAFKPESFLSISNDKSIGFWNLNGTLDLKIGIQSKPNWIETAQNNTIYVSDVTNKLSIYKLKQ